MKLEASWTHFQPGWEPPQGNYSPNNSLMTNKPVQKKIKNTSFVIIVYLFLHIFLQRFIKEYLQWLKLIVYTTDNSTTL